MAVDSGGEALFDFGFASGGPVDEMVVGNAAGHQLGDEFGSAFVGGGIRYVDSVKTDIDRATRDLPSYVLADASAGYDFDRFRVQVNIKNIFDKHYFVNNYQTLYYGNVVGEPRSVTVSLRATF